MAVALLATALFFIGGAVQDVDMHDLSEYPVEQQAGAYERLESRRDLGEAIQLWAALIMLVSFCGIAVSALIISSDNREKVGSLPLQEAEAAADVKKPEAEAKADVKAE